MHGLSHHLLDLFNLAMCHFSSFSLMSASTIITDEQQGGRVSFSICVGRVQIIVAVSLDISLEQPPKLRLNANFFNFSAKIAEYKCYRYEEMKRLF